MSSEVVIRLRNVSKSYRIFGKPQDRLKQIIWGARRKYYRDFPALKNIDLEVHRGETLGLVGANGSGKSTLLQVICGTLQADGGELDVRGRVAALLELGSGFNPEFTGRENIMMNSAILGMNRQEVARRLDEIIAFADIGEFLDQPVKTYSSGMFARLAFSVAIHAAPQILVIDEALAVGDEAFQRKCFAHIERIKSEGATILFVSHSAAAILELCDRAVLMHKGERILTGSPKTVVTQYQRLLYAPPQSRGEVLAEIHRLDTGAPVDGRTSPQPSAGRGVDQEETADDDFDPRLRPETTESYLCRGGEISDVRILHESGRVVNVLTSGRQYILEYRVRFDKAVADVRFSMLFKTVNGLELAAQWSAPRGEGLSMVAPGEEYLVRFPFALPLLPGTYFVNAGTAGIVDGEYVIVHRLIDVAAFRIRPIPRRRSDRYVDVTTREGVSVLRVSNAVDVEALNRSGA